ncbi:Cup9 protein [Candida orthopsilosis Co 90-125]|uniref:Cup9 protein n=1 Tax=Candida orthopsilosis (strain 90-125) TaxID=1136231 RepID=H8XAZ9_CANO9|nr:Cup9 protein [Candida orthopsilosis Co 90-125]CCG25247.1 Cup9 protein [Candida orthopsilosis Co 90-125]
MQLTELIHHSRSSTLPSISTASSYQHNTPLPLPSKQEQSQSQPKEAPHLAKRISLPPISDLLATPPPPPPQQQQQQVPQPHYNYYTTTATTTTNNDTLNRSPNAGYSTSSSISSPSSIQYHNQQSHYFHNNPSQQPQQLPSIIRSNSYPQQSTLSQDPNYPHHHLAHYPSHEYYPQPHPHPHQQQHYAPSFNTNSNNIANRNSSDHNGPNSKRKTRNNLPKEITYVLLRWLNDHLNHPYPNSFEKNQLMMATGLNQQQLSNWFINARRRKIKTLKEQKRMMHMV